MYSVVLMMAMTGGSDAPAGMFGRHGCCGGDSCCGGYVAACTGCTGCTGTVYSCSGCSGWSSCHGCSGGWGHGCCGGKGLFSGGLFSHNHGCCGGSSCCGGYSGCCGGSSSCHGCHGGKGLFSGGLFSHRHGCCGGSSCCGGYSCSGGYGCCGGYSCSGGYGCCGGVGCTGCTGGVGCVGCTGGVIQTGPVEMHKEEQINAPATLVVKLPADAKLMIDGNATTSTSDVRTFRTPALPTGAEFRYTLQAEVVREGKALTLTKTVTVRGGAETQVTFDAAELAAVASR
jgi:uncharacterized protein (TIGR03000 family)